MYRACTHNACEKQGKIAPNRTWDNLRRSRA